MTHNKYKKQPLELAVRIHEVEWVNMDKGLGLKIKTPQLKVEIVLPTGETLQGSVSLDKYEMDSLGEQKSRAQAAASLVAQAVEALVTQAEG